MFEQGKYSQEWTNILSKNNELQEAVGHYFQVSIEDATKDLKQALSIENYDKCDSDKILLCLCNLDFKDEALENVLDEWICTVLWHQFNQRIQGVVKFAKSRQYLRSRIVNVIFTFSAQYSNDPDLLHNAILLLYELAYKQELLEYFEKYREELSLELDEEDIDDFKSLIDCADD